MRALSTHLPAFQLTKPNNNNNNNTQPNKARFVSLLKPCEIESAVKATENGRQGVGGGRAVNELHARKSMK